MGVDSQVQVAIIATVGGVLTTFLTMKYKGQITRRNLKKQPKDRMESIFDGYESLIRELKDDSVRKSAIIENLQQIIDVQRAEIAKSQDLINTLRKEVHSSEERADELKTQLGKMKKDYVSNRNDKGVK